MFEVVPNPSDGEPTLSAPIDGKQGRGRPKGRKTGEGTTGYAARARAAGKKSPPKPKRESTPKRSTKAFTAKEIEKWSTLALRIVAGSEQIPVFELGEAFGMQDMTKSPEFAELADEDKQKVLEQQAAAQKMVDTVVERLRLLVPEDDRLVDAEAALLASVLADQSGKVNKAIGPFGRQIEMLLKPIAPVMRSLKREGRTAAVVAALLLPRMARRLPENRYVFRMLAQHAYGPVLMAARGARRGLRTDGLGEEHARRAGAAPASEVPPRDPNEAGQGGLPRHDDDPSGAGHGPAERPSATAEPEL